MMKKISVILVEDHPLVREMWANLFTDVHQIEIVGKSGELDEALEMIRVKQPDIILLDINLPQSSGMQAVPIIRALSPASKIIAVSMHNQPAYAKKMLQAGAMAYVTKNSPHQEILMAIETVMSDQTYVCSEIKNNLSDKY